MYFQYDSVMCGCKIVKGFDNSNTLLNKVFLHFSFFFILAEMVSTLAEMDITLGEMVWPFRPKNVTLVCVAPVKMAIYPLNVQNLSGAGNSQTREPRPRLSNM